MLAKFITVLFVLGLVPAAIVAVPALLLGAVAAVLAMPVFGVVAAYGISTEPDCEF